MALNIARIEVDYTPGLVGLDITDPEVGVQQLKIALLSIRARTAWRSQQRQPSWRQHPIHPGPIWGF